MSTLTKLISAIGIGTMTYLAGDTVYAQVRGRALTAEEVEGRAPVTSTPTPAAQQSGNTGPTCNPGEVCATPTPKKKVGPSKALLRLQRELGLTQEQAKRLEGVAGTQGTMIEGQRAMLERLEQRLQGYDALHGYITELQKNEGFSHLVEAANQMFAGLTGKKNEMIKSCGDAYAAQRKKAEDEKGYLNKREGLNNQILALQTDTNLTSMQRVERAAKLRAQINVEDQKYRKKNGALKTLEQQCKEVQDEYDTAARRLRDTFSGVRQWSVEPYMGWNRAGNADAVSVGADVCRKGKQGRLCVGAEVSAGQDQQSEPTPYNIDPTVTANGDFLLRTQESGTRATATQIQGALSARAMTRDFRLLRLGRKLKAAFGLDVDVYRAQEMEWTDRTRREQLLAPDGSAVGQEHEVSQRVGKSDTAYGVNAGAVAELCFRHRYCLDGKLGVDTHTSDAAGSVQFRLRY